MAEISTLGEFGLIRHLTAGHKPQQTSTITGVGDDCAVLSYPETEVLVSTDMLMEGIHFDLTYIDLEHLGYKSAMVNISDICAMMGTPRQMLVSIAIGSRLTVEDLEAFYKGLHRACDKFGIDIVGGDTTSSVTGLAISITIIGDAPKGYAVRRSTARPTDLICVSGDLGAAYMGLQLLEREKTVYYQQLREQMQKTPGRQPEIDFQPDFAGKEYLLERQMQPMARVDIVNALISNAIHPTSMIDISDGLSSEIHHICEQSGTGCRIYEKELPIDYETAIMAEEFEMNVTTCALNGGEDYELLFTVPIGDLDKVRSIEGVHIIGHITEEKNLVLVSRDQNEFELRAQGWTHQ